MRILFICDEYPPGKTGGIGTSVQLFAREMVKQNHQVWVAGLYSHTYGGKQYETDAGVNVIRLRYGPEIVHESLMYKAFKKLPDSIKSRWKGKKAFETFIITLYNLIEKEKIDIIELADWNTFAMHIGFDVSWPEFKVPLVVKAHGSYTKINHDLGRKLNKRFFEMDKRLYQRANAICAVSDDTAKTIKKLFHLKKEIRVTYNGIELMPDKPSNERNSNKVVFAGSLTRQKGVMQLIKAWNEVSVMRPSLRLFIYGKGKTEPLKALLNQEASKTVEFKSHISREELMREFETASLAVLPSYSETFGLVAVEAMSRGCPVIFTKRACGNEIIENGYNGYLVEPDNIEEISSTIVRMMDDEAKRSVFSKNGKTTVEQKFDIVKLTSGQINYFSEVIEKFPK
ncbi:MAG: glycosyltransferase family 4 protein [Bacteroidia bacterium]|nr:glycosyltransferase family 4 protein [Bacteroidia bacterium]